MSEFVMGARLNLEDSYTSQMKEANKATKMFKDSASGAMTAASSFGLSTGKLSDTTRKYKQEIKGAEDETKRMTEAGGGLNNSLSFIKNSMVAAAGAFGLMSAKKWLVDSNADMETYQNTLSVVLHSQKKAVDMMGWAVKFAAQTPFEIPQIVEATSKLESYGISSKKTLGTIGDMASVMGKDLMQAVEAVADAQTGEVERLKEFGITKQQIAQQAKLMGVTAVNAKGQIVDQKAFNAALFVVMNKRFKGGMDLQSKTFKGMLSNLQDYISTAGRTLGKPIFNELKVQLGSLMTYLNSATAKANIAKFMTDAAASMKSFFQVINVLVPIVVKFGPAILTIVSAFMIYKKTVMTVTAVTKAWATAQKILNGAMKLNMIGLIVTALIMLGAALLWAWNRFPKFRAVVINSLKAVANFFTVTIPAMYNTVKQWFTAMSVYLVGCWTSIKTSAITAWNALGNIVHGAVSGIKNIVITVFNDLVNGAKIIWNVLTFGLRADWYIITSMFKVATKLLTGDWKGAWNIILNMGKGLLSGFKNIFGNIGTLFYNSGRKLLETLANGIKAAVMAPVNAVKNGLKKIRALLPSSDAKEGPLSRLTFNGGKLMSTMATGVTAKAHTLHTAVAHAFADTPGISVKAKAINPAGGAKQSVGKSVTVAKLFDQLVVHAAPGMDEDKLANNVVDKFYERLSGANDIAGTADMGGLL